MRYVAIGLAGAAGALLRAAVSEWGARIPGGGIPIGTLICNLLGCFLLAFLYGSVAAKRLPEAWRLLVGTGLLGAFTTFSTFSTETVTLAREGLAAEAAVYVAASVAGGLAATLLGLWLAGLRRPFGPGPKEAGS